MSNETVTEIVETEIVNTLTDYQIAKKLIQLKQSADSRSINFDLKFKTVKRLLLAKKCYYTGIIFEPGVGLNSRSIDRVDPHKGYVDDNVVACTIDINSRKSNLDMKEITVLYKKILKHNSKNAK
jgi:hypothetical protein